MSFEEGAALPIVYPTSYAALIFRANLQAGETLLVHAASGGVGSAALQIGKALGARVIATVGGAEKAEIARELGADEVIDYREDDFVVRVKEITGGSGADVICDSVGGDVFDRSLKCIAWNGRLVVVGFASGRIPELKTNRILLKNIAVTGVHWGAYLDNEPERVPETFAGLFALYREGLIKPLIFNTYALEDLPSALAELASRKTHGKLIITP
jgi:NADPH2:quinone reductase